MSKEDKDVAKAAQALILAADRNRLLARVGRVTVADQQGMLAVNDDYTKARNIRDAKNKKK